MQLKNRADKIRKILRSIYPEVKTQLFYDTPFQLLVATMLSAQCTDVRVNIVTKTLFKKYRSAQDWANIQLAELEDDIRPTGFFRNKAKNIQAACRLI